MVMYTYRAYGLTLRLPFCCSGLAREPDTEVPDVTVEEGSVPLQLAAPLASGPTWQAEAGRFLLRGGRRAGRFLVEGSGQVTFQRSNMAEESMIADQFLTTVLSAVLHQQGLLVLHASAAVTPSGAVGISGESGVGKSTTVAALLVNGCSLLSDDITAVRLGDGGRVEALPGVPQLHLCEDAVAALDLGPSRMPGDGGRRSKTAITYQREMADEPVPLRALYVLRVHTQEGLRLRTLSGAQKFAALHDCLFGPLLSEEQAGIFPTLAALTEQVPVICIERPAGCWTVDQAVEAILNG